MKYKFRFAGNPVENDIEFGHIQTALRYARSLGYTIDQNTRVWGIKYALDHEGILLGAGEDLRRLQQ